MHKHKSTTLLAPPLLPSNFILLLPTLASEWWLLAPFIAHLEVLQVLDHLFPVALPGGAEDSSSWAQGSMQHPLAATPDPNGAVENSFSHGVLWEAEAPPSAREAATKRPGGEKVQAEIDSVLGQTHLPSMEDKVKMPYTEAVIHEIQRMGDIVPLNLFKMAVEDMTIGGYAIPKDTAVIINLNSILKDKSEWETPNTFNPGHFLTSDRKFQQREAFMPFSAVKVVNTAKRKLTSSEVLQAILDNNSDHDFSSSEEDFSDNDDQQRALHDTVNDDASDDSDEWVYPQHLNWTAARSELPFLLTCAFTFTGIGLDNDYKWKMHKKFTLSTLRNFGVGRRSLEFIILEELKVLSEALKEKQGQPFDPHLLTSTAISNVICSMLLGRRFEYSDAQFDELMHLINSAVYLEGSVWAQAYNAFPGIMKFLPGKHNELFSKYAQVFDFIRNEIEEHKKDWDPAAPRDYIDYYLSEMKKGNSDVAGFTEGTLTATVFDLFVAGSETTATTILWALLFMVKYPDVQEKVQTEIESVMGQDGPPSMDKRPQMPFTEAVICEVLRMGNVIPLSLTRITSDDISLGGYLIPKDTKVVINLSSVLNDKSEWETPDSFNPDHFLDSDGKFIRRDAFLPFLTGKRTCLGETLARMQVFLFFTSLLQKFTFRAPAGVEPSLKARNGFTRNPVPYKMCAIPRDQD
ncbi:CP2J2 protein, partial [Polypterus senegalus]